MKLTLGRLLKVASNPRQEIVKLGIEFVNEYMPDFLNYFEAKYPNCPFNPESALHVGELVLYLKRLFNPSIAYDKERRKFV